MLCLYSERWIMCYQEFYQFSIFCSSGALWIYMTVNVSDWGDFYFSFSFFLFFFFFYVFLFCIFYSTWGSNAIGSFCTGCKLEVLAPCSFVLMLWWDVTFLGQLNNDTDVIFFYCVIIIRLASIRHLCTVKSLFWCITWLVLGVGTWHHIYANVFRDIRNLHRALLWSYQEIKS